MAIESGASLVTYNDPMILRLLAAALAFSSSVIAQAQVNAERECDITSLQVCARHVAQDEAAILTSPLRIGKSDLLWILPFGVATGIAFHEDTPVMNRLGVDASRERTFGRVGDYGGIYGPVAATGVGYLAGVATHNDYLRQTAVLTGEAMVDATILNEGLKYAINRQDPKQGDGTGRFWPHGTRTWPDGQSMPSEHCMNAWAFAHVVASRYSGWATKLTVYSLASTVSASRILSRDHFPSDVVVGSTFGFLVGGVVAHHRGNENAGLSFSAVNTPNGKGFELAYAFGH